MLCVHLECAADLSEGLLLFIKIDMSYLFGYNPADYNLWILFAFNFPLTNISL